MPFRVRYNDPGHTVFAIIYIANKICYKFYSMLILTLSKIIYMLKHSVLTHKYNKSPLLEHVTDSGPAHSK